MMYVPVEYVQMAEDIAKQEEIDMALFKAIITVESDWRPNAMRFEKQYAYFYKPDYYAHMNEITPETETELQKYSYGLGQLMGGAARELGFTGPLTSLCDPKTGLTWAAKKLKEICKKYGKTEDQIAAYNAGSPRIKNGFYINQDYVDKVKKSMT